MPNTLVPSIASFVSLCSWVRRALVAVALSAILGACAHAPTHNEDDPVLVSFATVGDSRAEAGAPELSPQDERWLQNTPTLHRILSGITSQSPNLLFFNGDMIMGYTPDPRTMDRQYAFWRGIMARFMEDGTYVVPVPGNHEVQRADFKGAAKLARPENEALWRDNMGDLILDTARFQRVVGAAPTAFDPANHPAKDDLDHIASDQTRLSYSFDVRGTHFIIINTDPVGNDSHAPVHWLADDLAAAQARGNRRFFVFGHKPAYTYKFKGGDAIDGFDANPENQQAFWDLMERYNAVYFCGHQHIFHMEQPRLAQGGHAWQVMIGSGGSPFSAKTPTGNPLDRMYAWAQVQVRRSGRVDITAWGFDDKLGPTRVLQKVVVNLSE